METPPSLNAFLETTEQPYEIAFKEWELVLLAYQKYVKQGARMTESEESLQDIEQEIMNELNYEEEKS